MPHLKQPRIFQNTKFRAKLKIPEHGTKTVLFGCFGQQLWKPLSCLKSALPNLSICKVSCKTMNVWDQERPNLSIFRQNFEETYCHIWRKHSWICQSKEIHVTPKKLNLGQNSLLFGYIWIKIWKGYCHIWNQPSWIFQNVKSFVQK